MQQQPTLADDSQQRYGYINQTPEQQQQQAAASYAAPPQQDSYRYEEDSSLASPSAAYQPIHSPVPQPQPYDVAAEVNEFEQPAGAASWEGGEDCGLPPAEPPVEAAYPDDGGVAFATRRPIYLMYALSAWGDRMWEFAAVVFIISLYPTSLFYSALFGLIENLVGIVSSPWVGVWIDQHDRLRVMRAAIIGQNGAITVAGFVLWAALAGMSTTVDPVTGVSTVHAPKLRGLAYFILLAMGGVAKVASTGAKVSLHKDWIPVLAAGSEERLTVLNSSMRRIDLTASILAPLLVGLVSWGASEQAAVATVAFWSLASLLVELTVVTGTYNGIPALQQLKPRAREHAAARQLKKQQQEAEAAAARGQPITMLVVSTQVSLATLTVAAKAKHFLADFLVSMKTYHAHPVFRASLAYALLYVSVLSLGGSMTSWLKLRGVSDAILAVARGVAALVGIAATYAVPHMLRRWGTLHTGVLCQWAQLLCLAPVGLSFVYYFSSRTTQLVMLLVFLCLSRFGLWGFDLAQTQLLQPPLIEPQQVGAINGAQESAINIAYTCSFLLTMIFSSPDWFAAPVFLSLSAVFASTIIFTNWVADSPQMRRMGGGPFPPWRSLMLWKPWDHEEWLQRHQSAGPPGGLMGDVYSGPRGGAALVGAPGQASDEWQPPAEQPQQYGDTQHDPSSQQQQHPPLDDDEPRPSSYVHAHANYRYEDDQ